MRRIELTKQAAQDLRRERRYLETRRKGSGDDFVGAFVHVVGSLAKLPMTGRDNPTQYGRIRSLPKWHKVIAYDFDEDAVTVFAVRYTRRGK